MVGGHRAGTNGRGAHDQQKNSDEGKTPRTTSGAIQAGPDPHRAVGFTAVHSFPSPVQQQHPEPLNCKVQILSDPTRTTAGKWKAISIPLAGSFKNNYLRDLGRIPETSFSLFCATFFRHLSQVDGYHTDTSLL